jgi:glycine cleavage system H protein
MGPKAPRTIRYQRCNFSAQLPADCLYSPAHAWLARQDDGLWRVGLTKFATRMLGEIVDHAFDVQLNEPVRPGQAIGWIEGFKAIADLYCVGEGRFAGSNPVLKERIETVNEDPHGEGWLYLIEGRPDAQCVDVKGYCDLLDQTIDRLLSQQRERECQ